MELPLLIACRPPDRARVDALLDPQRVTQALVALADNAVRYTGDGDRISVGSQLSGGDLRFWISDTGPGIPEEERPRVFERFYRGRNVDRSIEGTGVGLSGVRQIVEQHGGTVSVESREREGSTFTVRLPLGNGVPVP